MKYITSLEKINILNIDLFYKTLSCSIFTNQKYIDDFHIYCNSENIEELKRNIIANKNIKIQKIDNINYGFSKYFLNSNKIISISIQNEKFLFIKNNLFLWNDILSNNKEKDFLFFSKDKSSKNKFNNFYKIGLDFLNSFNINNKYLKNIDSNNIKFNIYDTSIIYCNNINIIKEYFRQLREIFLFSKEIDLLINSMSKRNQLKYSKALTLVLENLLLSKIIKDNDINCDYLFNNNKNSNLINLNSLSNFNIIKNKASIISNKNSINDLYSKILDAGYCSINDYIVNFCNNDKFISKTSWGNDLKTNFLNEKNSGGGCSSCKLKRLKLKYDEIIKAKFE